MEETDALAPPRRRSGRPDKPIPRADLIRVARDLFAARGYAGVSMADIAHKAGLQKSSLFHHFPTKDQLYREVLDGVLTELTEAVSGALSSPSVGHVERFDSATVAMATSLGGDSSRARLIMRELLNEGAEKGRLDITVQIIEATAAFLEEGADAGAWPKQDFKQVVLTLAGIHCFYFAVPTITQAVSGTDPFSPEGVDARIKAMMGQARRLLGMST